jgi:hypothetical protein
MAGRANFGQISESEYSILLQALSSTTKGRSFLAEYLRRSRPEDTLALLGSLRQFETTMTNLRDQLTPERIASEMLDVALTLELATEGAARSDEETARRFSQVDRARHELKALARSLGGDDHPQAQASTGEPAIRLVDDEHTFFRELELDDQTLPLER